MILPKTFVTKICWAQKIFGPQFFWTNSFPIPQLFFNLNLLDQNLWNLTFFDPHFLDPALLGLKFVRHGLLLDQKVFGPNFFLSTTTTTRNKTLMGFDTIEINLVSWMLRPGLIETGKFNGC